MSEFEQIRQAKSLHKAALLARPHVVGLGLGYKTTHGRMTTELSLVVLVRHKVPAMNLFPDQLIPQEVDGIRTDVLEVGDLRPLLGRTDRWRPAPGGVSIGHYRITAGTLGGIVYDRKTGDRLILSNNHVLANSNKASLGDPILQPGPVDGGQLGRDVIARLERFYPLRFNTEPAECRAAQVYVQLGNFLARAIRSRHQFQAQRYSLRRYNQVDAAVARPLIDAAVLDQNLEIGQIEDVTQPVLGMTVRKSGRTTSFTTGEILVTDATISIYYDPQRLATFEDQIVTTAMSQGGDSGSLLVASERPHAVGLLFGGSNQSTLHNPIKHVLDSLDVTLKTPAGEPKMVQRTAAEKAQAVKQAYQDTLMAKKNVVGVGIGLRHRNGQRTDELGLVVLVSKKVPQAFLDPQDIIPSEIEGIPVDVKEVGALSPA